MLYVVIYNIYVSTQGATVHTLVQIVDRLWVCALLLLDVLQGDTAYTHHSPHSAARLPTSSALYDIHKNTALAWARLQGVVGVCQGVGEPAGVGAGGMRGAVQAALEEALSKGTGKGKGKHNKGSDSLLDAYHVCLIISSPGPGSGSGCEAVYRRHESASNSGGTIVTSSAVYARYNWTHLPTPGPGQPTPAVNTHIGGIVTAITRELISAFIYTYPSDKDAQVFKKTLAGLP